MKRNIEKTQLTLSTVKAQYSYFRTQFVNSMNTIPAFNEDQLPMRGNALLNFCTNIFFGYKNWELLKFSALNSEDKVNEDIYIYDEEYLKREMSRIVSYIQLIYAQTASSESIQSSLEMALYSLPKARTRKPLTKEGKKLCYLLCESQLRLTTPKNEVYVKSGNKEIKGLLTYFTHDVCPKTGGVGAEHAIVFIKGEGMGKYPLSSIRPVKEFDPFSAYRAFEIFGFQQFINEYSNSKSSVKQDITHHSELIENAKNEGKSVSVIIQHPITKEVHEYPVDDEFDLGSLRELYHDTQNLIFIAR